MERGKNKIGKGKDRIGRRKEDRIWRRIGEGKG